MFCTCLFRANFLLKQFFVKRKTVDSKLLVFFRRVFENAFTVEVQDFVKVVAILIAAHYIVIACSKKVTFLYKNTCIKKFEINVKIKVNAL